MYLLNFFLREKPDGTDVDPSSFRSSVVAFEAFVLLFGERQNHSTFGDEVHSIDHIVSLQALHNFICSVLLEPHGAFRLFHAVGGSKVLEPLVHTGRKVATVASYYTVSR